MTIKQLGQNINKKEWLFLAIIALLTILATSVPYLYGYLTAPENTYFLAVSGVNRVDYPNYFSYIEQVRSGHLLFKDLYTTEPQPRIILNLFFLGLGLIAKLFHLSAIAIFQITRIILIPVFIFIFYLFTKLIFKKKQKQKICLFLVCFSSGLGATFLPWLLNLPLYNLPNQLPMDLWVPEAITFFTFYTNPLFIFSLSLIISIFLLMLLGLENKGYKYSIAAGVLGLVLFQIHPYHFPTIFLTLGLFWLFIFFKKQKINWAFLKQCCVFFIVSLPSLVYYWWLSTTHWLTIHRISQAAPAVLTPSLVSFILSYGLLWPLVIIGVYSILKNKKFNNYSLFLITWLISQIFLVYSPLPLQRKLSEGLHLILCVLATLGLFFLYQKLIKVSFWQKSVWLKNKFLWLILFMILFSFSNIYIIARDIKYFSHPCLSVEKSVIQSMTWLRKNSSEQNIILSDTGLIIGNLLPAFAVRKVYAGHGAETAYAKNKEKEVSWFLGTNNHDQRSFS